MAKYRRQITPSVVLVFLSIIPLLVPPEPIRVSAWRTNFRQERPSVLRGFTLSC